MFTSQTKAARRMFATQTAAAPPVGHITEADVLRRFRWTPDDLAIAKTAGFPAHLMAYRDNPLWSAPRALRCYLLRDVDAWVVAVKHVARTL